MEFKPASFKSPPTQVANILEADKVLVDSYLKKIQAKITSGDTKEKKEAASIILDGFKLSDNELDKVVEFEQKDHGMENDFSSFMRAYTSGAYKIFGKLNKAGRATVVYVQRTDIDTSNDPRRGAAVIMQVTLNIVNNEIVLFSDTNSPTELEIKKNE